MTIPPKVAVILVRGLLGMIYSRGMDTLAAKLSAKGYQTQVWNHSWFFLAWFAYKEEIAAEIDRLARTGYTVVLVGHSFGANVLFMALRLTKTVVPLFVAVDPAAQYDTTLPTNVKRAIGIRQQIGAIGRGRIQPVGDKRIQDVVINSPHTYLDDDPNIHGLIIGEIAKV